ncbi:CapA family protein [Streptosporangium sp. NPDC006007]|uniref:CapA family protein n=1 Tax=Streptosporangium sp. NPDC006007 TaxID=3154575 RepID=UPI0033A6132B
MSITVALAGDTMLGRGVAERVSRSADLNDFFSGEMRDRLAGADFFLLNLECCVSARGVLWDAPGKPFHFRAPPQAAELLAGLGVGCVTLANNHALDFGYDALRDTRRHLDRVGIRCVGAGDGLAEARRPVEVTAGGLRLGIVACGDHPRDFAAAPHRPGIAHAALTDGVPPWLPAVIGELRTRVDAVLVTPHWGPNMVGEPLPYVRAAAGALVEAGATLVAGHSAHVFHGVAGRVLYDLGDFIDDYAVHPVLRNDLGLLWLVTLDQHGPVRLRALPLKLDYGRTRLAEGADWCWVRDRLTLACARMGTSVSEDGREIVVEVGTGHGSGPAQDRGVSGRPGFRAGGGVG